MTLRVFIASSTEGLTVTEAVQGLLKQKLGEKADVTLWTRKFEFSSTYIESLEEASRETDSAVLVFTPDDVTTSREAEKLAPRDNVVFELGLFIGSLGRKRCILVHEERPELKLSTDLFGVKTATFRGQKALEAALDPLCGSISKHITSLGSRHKLSLGVLAAQAAMRDFYDRIKGAWWERITEDGSHSISLVQIEWEASYNSVQLEGTVYNTEGSLKAYWESAMARVRKEEQNILYLRRCWLPAARNKSWFHGIGDMDFKGSAESDEMIDRGYGKFSQFNEADPKRTVVIPVEFRRILVEKEVSTMNKGSEKDRRALIIKTLGEW